MVVAKSWLRWCATVVLGAGLLGLALGCKGKSKSGNEQYRTLSGNVTYLRRPLMTGTDGVPLGIDPDDSHATKVGASGVSVRVFQASDVTKINDDGSTSIVQAWYSTGSTVTDENGHYSVTGLTDASLTFVELYSTAQGTGSILRLVGDPDGINSTVAQASRVLYCMRKGADGSVSATNPTPGTALSADTTVDFAVGLNDSWLLAPASWAVPATGPFTMPPSVAAGSRVLAILDTVYKFRSVYGDPTPGGLDLHYYPGRRESRGSFVEYDLKAYPHSYSGGSLHYFGSLAGDSTSDDAFNEGVIYPLLAQNNLVSQGKSTLKPVSARIGGLSPTLAVIEGLPDAMAANMLRSPYLPDTSLPARFPPRDIRVVPDLPAGKAAFSAPHIAAMTWEMVLKANNLSSPAVPADWATITRANILRLFSLTSPTTTLNSVSVATDIPSFYSQVARLKESKSSSDAVDLASIFTDAVLTPLLAKGNLSWPTLSPALPYAVNWNGDPDTLTAALPAFTLSMADAVPVRGVYPNVSVGEVAWALFSLTKDRGYNLGITTVPDLSTLPSGVSVEVLVDGGSSATFHYGPGYPAINNVKLAGNASDTTTPKWHWIQFRIISPDASAKQPDLRVTVTLAKTN